jgi:hypothetical protein
MDYAEDTAGATDQVVGQYTRENFVPILVSYWSGRMIQQEGTTDIGSV